MMSVILLGCLAEILGFLIPPTDYNISEQYRKVKFAETFKLKPSETAQTEDGKLWIQLKNSWTHNC